MQTHSGMLTAMADARALGKPVPWLSEKFQMNQDCAIIGSGCSMPTIAFSAPYFNLRWLCQVGI
jgi:hypothetical protein